MLNLLLQSNVFYDKLFNNYSNSVQYFAFTFNNYRNVITALYYINIEKTNNYIEKKGLRN